MENSPFRRRSHQVALTASIFASAFAGIGLTVFHSVRERFSASPAWQEWEFWFSWILAFPTGTVVYTVLLFLLKHEESQFSPGRDGSSAQRLLNNIPGMVYQALLDDPWILEYVSEGSHDLAGYSPSQLMHHPGGLLALVHPEDRDRVKAEIQRGLAKGESFQISYRILAAGGEERWVQDRGREVDGRGRGPRRREGILGDITQETRMRQQLLESQRLEALGTLAAEVAHDFNNALTAITGYTQLTLGRIGPDSPATHDLLQIRKGGA